MYKILLLILSLSLFSCAGNKIAYEGAKLYGGVIIDEEIEPVMNQLLHSLNTIGNGLQPNDFNYERFLGLNTEYNCIVDNMGSDIQNTGTLIYEDYKENLLILNQELELLSNKYPEASNAMIDILIPVIQDMTVKYARFYVGREFKRKLKYGTESCKIL